MKMLTKGRCCWFWEGEKNIFCSSKTGRDKTKVRDGHHSGASFLVRHLSIPGMMWEPDRSDWTTSLGRQPAGDRGPFATKIQGPRRRIHDGHSGPRPHRNLFGCQRNQGPRTRTSLLRHQLSRRKPSPVHKAYEAWAAWKMLPRRHCSDVPRTSPDILEPSGDSASGCIAPKPSPDPVLTPSHEKPVNPQVGERRAEYESAASGGSGSTLVGIRGSRCKQAGKRLQKPDVELTKHLHAASIMPQRPPPLPTAGCLLSRRHEVVGVEIEIRPRGGIDEPDLDAASPSGIRLEENA